MSDPIGFPLRPLRDAFGPSLKNRYPVRNPAYETDGEVTGNLLFDQIAGMGLTAVIAWLVVKTTTAPTCVLLSRQEAWNTLAQSTGAYAPPDVVRASAGVIDITYPAQVPDYKGVLRTLTFSGGVALYLDDSAAFPLVGRVIPDMSGGLPAFSSHVKVRGWQLNGAAQNPLDGVFLIGLV
jgi:hypothetical protein